MEEDAQVLHQPPERDFETCKRLDSLNSRRVLGPNGEVLTPSNLPGSTTGRWVIRRKAEVVAAVQGELLSLEEACRRYTLTIDEFRAWELSLKRHGFNGLKATRLQFYRGRTTRLSPSRPANPRRKRRGTIRPNANAGTQGRDWLFVGSCAGGKNRTQRNSLRAGRKLSR